MQGFLRFFGHGFCHQIPERSFESGGLLFPVCARDTGIYLGFLCALLAAFVIYVRSPRKPAELPPVPYLVVLALFVVPMAFDGVTSYLGLRPTTNTIRYVTGFLAGTAAASLVAPLLFALRRDAAPREKVFATPSRALSHLALSFLLGAAFLLGFPLLGPVSPFVAVVALLVTLASLDLVLLTLSTRLAPRHRFAHWLFLLACATLLALAEVALFGALRDLLIDDFFGGRYLYDILALWGASPSGSLS
jgi:uncharacterized membrane protein